MILSNEEHLETAQIMYEDGTISLEYLYNEVQNVAGEKGKYGLKDKDLYHEYLRYVALERFNQKEAENANTPTKV